MNIHEYQAKQLLARQGVAVPTEQSCGTVEEATAAAEERWTAGHRLLVVKSQIHAGGRGKGTFQSGFQGGVQVSRSVSEVAEHARAMLGNVLVTKQTGPNGRRVNTVLVAGAETILKEFYLAVLLDRASCRPLLMASTEGGMDIEEVAATRSERIFLESVDPAVGLMPFQARKLAARLGLRGKLIQRAADLFVGVYRTWWECDASLVEINPLGLVKTSAGEETLLVVDAKMSLDDNGLYRHPEIEAMRDLAEEAPLEIAADQHGLNYIKLDGDIACLVNGAGLAMATMDIIQHYGGTPANFLDVGGGANLEQVAAAFSIILSDPNVRGILVNIFGGIMQCDVIAQGIVAALKKETLNLPLVVRLEGNNVQIGKDILETSGLNLISGDSLADAAQKIVQAVSQ